MTFEGRDWRKHHRISVRMVSLWAKIWTWDLWNTKQLY